VTRPKPSNDTLKRAVTLYPIGSTVEAPVGEVWPFGLFVDLPDVGLVGFVAYPNLDPAGSPVEPGSDDVPEVGDRLRVVVLEHQLSRRQLWLSCRLSDFPEP
jgi:ribosomal protein S1